MEFFTLDNQLRRIAIFDMYESLVWTERFRLAGDFQLEIASDRNSRSAIVPGTFCTVDNTDRVCQIDTVVDTLNSDGTRVLKVSGRGVEAVVLGDRVATPGLVSLTATPKWDITGLPAAIARKVFTDICITKINNASDGVPFYTAGTIFTAGTIAEPSEEITISLDIDSVYNVLVKLCDLYKMGFRLVRNADASQLYFDVYTGDDHTTLQSVRPAVVFSPELDNLSDTSELTSVALQKTVAYVMSKNGSAIAYGIGWDAASAVGFNRRVMYVNADDIDLVAGAPLTAALIQRGKEKLAENQVVIAFDGEVPQFGSYSYGPNGDYDLGDLVEVRSSDGLATNMRVDEQIRTSDASGEKSYPTLVSELLITPGSWLSWDTLGYWNDALGDWADV